MGKTNDQEYVIIMEMSKIKIPTNSVCPICRRKVTNKNMWVRYHVRYNPVIEIYACKWCNFTEFLLRNNIHRTSPNITPERIEKVINYQKKFGIII